MLQAPWPVTRHVSTSTSAFQHRCTIIASNFSAGACVQTCLYLGLPTVVGAAGLQVPMYLRAAVLQVPQAGTHLPLASFTKLAALNAVEH